MEKKKAFVYLLTLRETGQVYVGKSIHPDKRWQRHMQLARLGESGLIYDAIRQFGPEAFDRQIIDEYPSEEEALLAEESWKSSLRSQGIELFNGVENEGKPWGGTSANSRGRKASIETKAKISATLRGRVPWNKGIQLSDEYRAKLSSSRRGKKRSDETKRKLSEATRRWRLRQKLLKLHQGFVRSFNTE